MVFPPSPSWKRHCLATRHPISRHTQDHVHSPLTMLRRDRGDHRNATTHGDGYHAARAAATAPHHRRETQPDVARCQSARRHGQSLHPTDRKPRGRPPARQAVPFWGFSSPTHPDRRQTATPMRSLCRHSSPIEETSCSRVRLEDEGEKLEPARLAPARRVAMRPRPVFILTEDLLRAGAGAIRCLRHVSRQIGERCRRRRR